METPQEQELLQQKEFLLNGTPVAMLTGNEFAPKEGITLTQQVIAYYNSINNKAISPAYGEIILDKKGIDDDLAHGMGRMKAAAFAAVPKIIESGIVILPFGSYKKENEKILSAMVAAPILIAQKEYIGVVVLRKRQDVNKLYVHEVTLKEKLLVRQSAENSNKKLPSGSSNPTQSLATDRGVNKLSDGSSSPALQERPAQATNQGAIVKVLQNIVSAKSPSQDLQKNLAAVARVRPAARAVKRKGRGL
jgi:hypothetical protein